MKLVTKPARFAGGLSALLSSLKHVFTRLGLWRGIRLLLKINQKSGFDCPGCAWPDPKDCSTFEFCENGVKAVAEEAMARTCSPDFFAKFHIDQLKQKSDYWLGEQGRLTHPMYKAPDTNHYEAVSWDQALTTITTHLQNLENPDQALFYTSGRTSNEAAYLYQLMVRKFGTNNLPDCSNMCHESSGVGLNETIGVGKGTVYLEDFEKTELILVIGQNPGTNHPRMLSALQKAVRNGAQVISINPMREAGTEGFAHPQEVSGLLGFATPLSHLHLPVMINGDVALLQGLAKSILENHPNALDRDFIASSTTGFDDYEKHIKAVSWQDIETSSQLARAQIDEAASLLAHRQSTIFCWAMGLTQHKNAVSNIQEVVNLALMLGRIGQPGSGLCPVRGHSNVQGDRTMGIYEKPSPSFLQRLGEVHSFSPPQHHGLDTVAAIQAMLSGEARVFFAMGGNFLSAAPDFDATAQALQNCDLTVQVSTKLNRGHAYPGKSSIILPCLARTDLDKNSKGEEQFVTVENSMSFVHSSRGNLTPPSQELKSEVRIICDLAGDLLGENWNHYAEDYGRIRDSIEQTIPGFENFNSRIGPGFYLPNPPRDSRQFFRDDEDSQKASFTCHDIPHGKSFADDEFLMMTIRSHDQYNTTVYGLDDRYRGIYGGRNVVFVNEFDYDRMGLSQTRRVNLISDYNGTVREAQGFVPIRYEMPKSCIATYFPECNVLIPVSEYAAKSRTPASKSIRVRIQEC